MRELRGKTALVTGAASGIGREIALALAREGAVVLLADIADLGEVAAQVGAVGAECRTYALDVSDREQVDALAASVLEEFGAPDLLVNNAGVFVWADFVDTALEDWEWTLGVNLWGPVHTMRAFLPRMIERRSGHIVNVASGGGLVTIPCLSAYSASKFALVGLGETVQHEVERFNIVLTTVCPGSTKTPIIGHIRVRGLDRRRLEKFVFPLANRFSAEKTAALVVEAVKKDRRLVVTTAQMKAMVFAKRVSPSLYRAMVRPFARFFYRALK